MNFAEADYVMTNTPGMLRAMGGHVRVGLEDNLWLDKGVLATNAQLVERAVGIIEGMGARVIGPAEVREKLGLVKRAPRG
jgi:uncharacterized protein (DUF849 family)